MRGIKPEPVLDVKEKWASDWFVESYYARPLYQDHLEARYKMLKQLRDLLPQFPSMTSLDDFGCGDGSFLRDAAFAFPELQQLRGYEMSSKGLELLRDRYQDEPRLSFAPTSVPAIAARSDTVLTTSGTLQYMPQDELIDFFDAISKRPRLFVMSEISNYKLEDHEKSEPRRYDAINHSYTKLLADAGFRILRAEVFAFKPAVDWIVLAAANSPAA